MTFIIFSTWFEKYDGLQTSKLRRVNVELLVQFEHGVEAGEGGDQVRGELGEPGGAKDCGGVQR